MDWKDWSAFGKYIFNLQKTKSQWKMIIEFYYVMTIGIILITAETIFDFISKCNRLTEPYYYY